jgi:hypothetical protein
MRSSSPRERIAPVLLLMEVRGLPDVQEAVARMHRPLDPIAHFTGAGRSLAGGDMGQLLAHIVGCRSGRLAGNLRLATEDHEKCHREEEAILGGCLA